MKKVLFVCTANRFRSRLQEAYADKYLKGKAEFDSCGIGSKEYGLTSPKKLINEAKTLMKIDEDIFLHESKEITKKLVKWADIIVYQQKSHLTKMEIRFPDDVKKFVFLGDYYDRIITRVTDLAFVSDKDEYREAMKEICTATKKLVKKLC